MRVRASSGVPLTMPTGVTFDLMSLCQSSTTPSSKSAPILYVEPWRPSHTAHSPAQTQSTA
jgi:hypothetical protein